MVRTSWHASHPSRRNVWARFYFVYELHVGGHVSCRTMASSEKTWAIAVAESRNWSDTNSHSFKQDWKDKKAARIYFTGPYGSFYITVPGSHGPDEWVRSRYKRLETECLPMRLFEEKINYPFI